MKILLIGDSCIDEYQYGTVDRLSPEAPVPVFKTTEKFSRPGMAGNVRENFCALKVDTLFISSAKSTKTRLIDEKSRQQVVRIDNDIIVTTPLKFDAIDPKMLEVDAVVISDYNKGLVSYELIEDMRENFKGHIFIDTKKQDIARMHGCYVKINEHEYNQRWSINDKLIVTLGSKGAMFKTGRDPRHETKFSAKEVEVVDVTGAGDTFLASLVYKFIETNDISKSIEFAISAATVTVQHMGVYAPTLEEIV